jgi:hypothetical protein
MMKFNGNYRFLITKMSGRKACPTYWLNGGGFTLHMDKSLLSQMLLAQ